MRIECLGLRVARVFMVLDLALWNIQGLGFRVREL